MNSGAKKRETREGAFQAETADILQRLRNRQVDNETLELKVADSLHEENLAIPPQTLAEIFSLLRSVPSITNLVIKGSTHVLELLRAYEEAWAILAQTKISSLTISDIKMMKTETLQTLIKKLPLTCLKIPSVVGRNINAIKIESSILTAISKAPGLKILRLDGSELDDDQVRIIAKMPVCEDLDISFFSYDHRSKVTENAMAGLAQMPSLRSLNVSGHGIQDLGATILLGSASLRDLHMRDCGLTDKAFDIGSPSDIQVLEIAGMGMRFRANVIKNFSNQIESFPALTRLSVDHAGAGLLRSQNLFTLAARSFDSELALSRVLSEVTFLRTPEGKLNLRGLEPWANNPYVHTFNFNFDEKIASNLAAFELALTNNTWQKSSEINFQHGADKESQARMKLLRDKLSQNSKEAKAFLSACKQGDLETVKRLYQDYHVSPFSVNSEKQTGLHLAVVSQKIAVVKFFLEVCPQAKNVPDAKGLKPLTLATQSRNQELISILSIDYPPVLIALKNNLNISALSFTQSLFSEVGAEALVEALKLNRTLESLDLSGSLRSCGYEGDVLRAVSQHPSLRILKFENSGLKDGHFEGFHGGSLLEFLFLSKNNLGDAFAKQIAQLAQLNTLDLADNSVQAGGAGNLAGSSVRTLNLQGNLAGYQGVMALMRSPSLESLNVSNNKLRFAPNKGFKNNTVISPQLRILNLSFNALGLSDIRYLAKRGQFESLDLSGVQISEIGFKKLSKNTHLRELVLMAGYFTPTPHLQKALARVAQFNILNTLELSFCKVFVGQPGLASALGSLPLQTLGLSHANFKKSPFFKSISENKVIKRLVLRDVEMGDAEMLQISLNSNIVSLTASHNHITHEGLRKLALMKSLENLDVSGNKIQDAGVTLLLQNRSIQVLNLSGNQLSEHGVSSFLSAPHIQELDLTGNPIEAEILGKIQSSIRQNKKLIPREKDAPATQQNNWAWDESLITQAPVSASHLNSLEIHPEELSYQERDVLGEGAYGVVYRGRYHHTDVAIKKLLFDPSADKQAFKSFIEEAEMMANLRHPNIIQFFGMTRQSPLLIVMEWMQQGSLFDVLHSDASILVLQQKEWVVQITKGLHYLHALKNTVLHRDLKSLNVLIGQYQEAKLTDFGLAMARVRSVTKTLVSKNPTATAQNAVGSLRWMAPELFALKPAYSKASDVYALGMVMWEIFTREVPYQEVSSDHIIQECVQQGQRETIPESVPSVFATVIWECWEQDPGKRPDTDRLLESFAADTTQGSRPVTPKNPASKAQSLGYLMS